MRRKAKGSGTPWKWDTTLLDRDGWKCDSSQCGDLWKLEDGMIVLRTGGIWEGGYYTDYFIQGHEIVTLCSSDNGVSWKEYEGPPLNNAGALSDGTLIERVGGGVGSARREEMKALVRKSLGLAEEDLSDCYFGYELWAESQKAQLAKEGYEVVDIKGMPGVVCTLDDRALAYRRSLDGGKTWERRRVEGLPHVASLCLYGKPVVLADDTILFAAWGKKRSGDPWTSFALRSRDRGETWEASTIGFDTTGANGYDETDILELPDGRLLALLRHSGPGADGRADEHSPDRYICRCYSEDGGATWGEVERTPIWGYPFRSLFLRSGKILGTYAYRRRPDGVRGCLSHDLGKTWDIENEIIIRDDGRRGGPIGSAQSIQAQDGTILTFYGISKIGRVKPTSPFRWYPDEVHCYVGLSRYTEDYVRARGQEGK